jgi:hypothetical protein
MLMGVVSARTITGVLMSSGFGGYETATPHVTTPRSPCTTPPSLQIITPQLRCPELLHRIPEICPNYAIKGSSTTPRPLITTPLHIMGKYTVTWNFNMPTIEYSNYLLSRLVIRKKIKGERNKQSCDVRVSSKYFTTKAPECYTTTYVDRSYYTKAPE